MNNKFFTDFEYFTNKIRSNEPFAYARYADGEVALIKGKSIGLGTQAYTVDKWSSPNQETIVGRQLQDSLSHIEDNYYYAISAPSDSKEDYEFLKAHLRTDNITFANLWINANYQRMKEFFKSLDKSVYVICNHKAKPENFPFKVTELFPFPDDCILYWTEHGRDYLNQLLSYVEQVNGQTFLISCGPISEILIHHMYITNPNNQYVDVGSSIDEFVHLKITRPYMIPETQYAREVSYFEDER
jgi:hypothetical protein